VGSERHPASREYLAHFHGSRYFELVGTVANETELERAIDTRAAYLALVVPPDFAERLGAGRAAAVQVVMDGSDSNTAAIVLGYAQAITQSFNQRIALEQLHRDRGPLPAGFRVASARLVQSRPRVQELHHPGLTAVIMGLIAALLTSLTIAREWERGTMEQLIATPVRPAELILGKLLPYLAIGLLDVLIAVLMAVFLFDVPLRGSVRCCS
jgi:ABC-2 type transport system permease protein